MLFGIRSIPGLETWTSTLCCLHSSWIAHDHTKHLWTGTDADAHPSWCHAHEQSSAQILGEALQNTESLLAIANHAGKGRHKNERAAIKSFVSNLVSPHAVIQSRCSSYILNPWLDTRCFCKSRQNDSCSSKANLKVGPNEVHDLPPHCFRHQWQHGSWTSGGHCC